MTVTGMATQPRISEETKRSRLKALKEIATQKATHFREFRKDYLNAWVDGTGRVVVKVNEEASYAGKDKEGNDTMIPYYPESDRHLYRKVWGPEWPIVRSEYPNAFQEPDHKDQLLFISRDPSYWASLPKEYASGTDRQDS